MWLTFTFHLVRLTLSGQRKFADFHRLSLDFNRKSKFRHPLRYFFKTSVSVSAFSNSSGNIVISFPPSNKRWQTNFAANLEFMYLVNRFSPKTIRYSYVFGDFFTSFLSLVERLTGRDASKRLSSTDALPSLKHLTTRSKSSETKPLFRWLVI